MILCPYASACVISIVMCYIYIYIYIYGSLCNHSYTFVIYRQSSWTNGQKSMLLRRLFCRSMIKSYLFSRETVTSINSTKLSSHHSMRRSVYYVIVIISKSYTDLVRNSLSKLHHLNAISSILDNIDWSEGTRIANKTLQNIPMIWTISVHTYDDRTKWKHFSIIGTNVGQVHWRMFASGVLGMLTWSDNMMVILTWQIPQVLYLVTNYCPRYKNKMSFSL